MCVCMSVRNKIGQFGKKMYFKLLLIDDDDDYTFYYEISKVYNNVVKTEK